MFQSTPSLRRATIADDILDKAEAVSIHALLAESDCSVSMFHGIKRVSIHALLAESDLIIWMNVLRRLRFQSTPSLRRATSEFEVFMRIS